MGIVAPLFSSRHGSMTHGLRPRSCIVGISALCMVLARPATAFLAADINCDGSIDAQDVTALISLAGGWDMRSTAVVPDCSDGDANGDGAVEAADLVAVLLAMQPPATP